MGIWVLTFTQSDITVLNLQSNRLPLGVNYPRMMRNLMRGFSLMDDITKWIKRIGPKKALEKRQEDRQAMKLNRPLRVWGIAKWAKYLRDEGLVTVKLRSNRSLL